MGSVDELKYCQTDKPEFLPLDLDLISRDYLTFIITEVQPTYFVAESFEKAKIQVDEYCKKMTTPFNASYN